MLRAPATLLGTCRIHAGKRREGTRPTLCGGGRGEGVFVGASTMRLDGVFFSYGEGRYCIMWERSLTMASKAFCTLFGLHAVHVQGMEHYEVAKQSEEHAVLVFNHVLFTDIALLVGYIDRLSFVGRKEHLEVPLIHWIAHSLSCIPVPSSDPRQTVTDQIIERVLARKKGEPLLAIAPDAAIPATAETGPISPFRTGAFMARAKVVPVVIRYFPEMPAWHAGQTMIDVMKERWQGPPLSVAMCVLPAMHVLPGEDPVAFRERVRSAMTQTFLQLTPT